MKSYPDLLRLAIRSLDAHIIRHKKVRQKFLLYEMKHQKRLDSLFQKIMHEFAIPGMY
jgi:hypothetical protein